MAGSAKSPGTAEILVVDDDREVLQAAKGILIIAGYRVHVASRPSQAMQILDSDRKIDLLLTDEAMPDMDGLAATRAIIHRKSKRDAAGGL